METIGIRVTRNVSEPVTEWGTRDLFIKFMSEDGNGDKKQADTFEQWLLRTAKIASSGYERFDERKFLISDRKIAIKVRRMLWGR